MRMKSEYRKAECKREVFKLQKWVGRGPPVALAALISPLYEPVDERISLFFPIWGLLVLILVQ